MTVLVCGDTGEVLAIVRHRSSQALSGFLAAQGHRWQQGVKVVVSDGSKPYKAAIDARLGHARHVLDRFHVIGWFAAGLTAVCRDIQRRPEGSTQVACSGWSRDAHIEPLTPAALTPSGVDHTGQREMARRVRWVGCGGLPATAINPWLGPYIQLATTLYKFPDFRLRAVPAKRVPELIDCCQPRCRARGV